MLIPWRCGTCNAEFPSQDTMRWHRREEHPEKEARAVAYNAAIDGGASEDEADLIADRAEADFLANVEAKS